jgi:hypothetical protein
MVGVDLNEERAMFFRNQGVLCQPSINVVRLYSLLLKKANHIDQGVYAETSFFGGKRHCFSFEDLDR